LFFPPFEFKEEEEEDEEEEEEDPDKWPPKAETPN
jgi:hypothetical protein